jgi:hypothetical protein
MRGPVASRALRRSPADAAQAALHGLLAKVRDLGLELLAVAAPTRLTPTWKLAMQQVAVPERERRTPRRRQLQVTRRRHRRGPRSPIDRRTPSGRLLPY